MMKLTGRKEHLEYTVQTSRNGNSNMTDARTSLYFQGFPGIVYR